jgi:hypothetical protein
LDGSSYPNTSYAHVLRLFAGHGGRCPIAGQDPRPQDVTVNEVILASWKDRETRRGKADRELQNYRKALRILRELYGPHPARDSTPAVSGQSATA